MGKVLEKLAKMPAVKSLSESADGISIVLTDGRESTVKTAHAARLFIQGTKATASRTTATPENGNDNGEGIVVPLVVPEIRVPRYPGMQRAAERDGEEYVVRPIWVVDKGFSPNSAEGADAFKRGYDRKSHYYGESSAAKEFEQAWDSAKRDADRKAAEQAN
jgi:hypothetical protein